MAGANVSSGGRERVIRIFQVFGRGVGARGGANELPEFSARVLEIGPRPQSCPLVWPFVCQCRWCAQTKMSGMRTVKMPAR